MVKHTASERIRFVVKVGILSAIAFVVMQLEIPVWFAPGFYKLDLSEVVALIGTFALGPAAGVMIELVKNLLNAIGTQTAYVGEFAAFCMGCALILPAGLIYSAKKTKGGAAVGLVVGIISMTVIASLLNYYVMLPLYSTLFELPLETIIGMGNAVNRHIDSLWDLIFLAVVPFNLFKGVICGVVTMLLYKHLSPILKK